MNWGKYDLVEHRRGRYRLERQTWSVWDWALAFIVACVLWRFWWVLLGILAALAVGFALVVLVGVLLAFVSTHRR